MKSWHSFQSALNSYNQASCSRVSLFPCSDSEEAFSFLMQDFFLLLHLPLKYHEEFKSHYSTLMTEKTEYFFIFPFAFLSAKETIFSFSGKYIPTFLLRYFSPRWDTFSCKVLKKSTIIKHVIDPVSSSCFIEERFYHNQCLHNCCVNIYMTWPLNNFFFKWLIPLQFHF